jgi:GDYXXLXY protein
MTISLAQRLLAAGFACILALIGLVVIEGRARAAGREVILRMQPVDPRALLTGHYVQLSFADVLEPGEACPPLIDRSASVGPSDPDPYTPSWLALRRDGEVHVLAGEYLAKDEAAQHGEIVVRGAAQCIMQFAPQPRDSEAPPQERNTVILDLAIDRFHADQDEAMALEKILRDREQVDRMAAIVSVGPDGTARTKGIIVDGKRVELTWF